MRPDQFSKVVFDGEHAIDLFYSTNLLCKYIHTNFASNTYNTIYICKSDDLLVKLFDQTSYRLRCNCKVVSP